MEIGKILLRQKLISPNQLTTVLALQHFVEKRLGELLLEEGLVTREQLQIALQEQYWRKEGYWVIG